MNIELIEPEQQTGTALVPVAERAQLALASTATEAKLRELATKHANLIEIKDRAGRDQVHGAAMELMRARTTISKTSKEARDDAVKFSKAVVSEEARLVAIVEPEELRLKGLRDAWDAEQARAKAEAERLERERLLALGARIQEIRGFARLAQDCRSSDAVRRLVERLAGLDMTGFAEFEAEAANVLTETRQQVEQVLNSRLATEAEAARIKAEREELARQQAEAQRKADELAAQQKAEADRLAAERAEFARQQQEAADKLAEQQAEVARMRAEIEAAKATIPAEVAPEKQAMADAVREIAGVGIAIANDLMNTAPDLHVEVKCSTSEPSQHAAQIAGYEFVTDLAVSTIPGADLVDTVSMQDDGKPSAPDAGVPWDTSAESAEVRLGFDMAMSMPITTTTPAFIGIDHGTDTPPAVSLINCIAQAYGVDNETACHWLCVRADDFLEWVEPTATPA